MRRSSEGEPLTDVSAVLRDLADTVGAVEDDLLASLVVMGETEAQQVVDGWVDQVVDLLRSVGEVTVQHRSTLARASARRGVADEAHAGTHEGAGARLDDPVGSEDR